MSSHEIARHWRLRKFRYSLEGNGDPEEDWKGLTHFAEGGQGQETQLPKNGRLVSWTTTRDGVVVALVEVGGQRLTAQLTDLGDREIHKGMSVEMVTRRLRGENERGLVIYGYKFRPVVVDEGR